MAEKTNSLKDIKIPNSSFYYSSEFKKDWINDIPVAYAMDIALENYFSGVFEFPLDRIIYATNDYTFYERERKNDGNLNLPYMSYARIGYSETDREWMNNYGHLIGLRGCDSDVISLGKNLRYFPIKMEYEGIVCFSQQKDLEYAYRKIAYESANETIIYPQLESSDGTIIRNVGIFNVDIEFNPSFNESEWLEKNRIFTLGLDFSCDTYLIMSDSEKISVAKSVELEFITAKKLNRENSEESVPPMVILNEYFGNV